VTLKPCKECGQPVSTAAKACPHCGAPTAHGAMGELGSGLQSCGCLLTLFVTLPLLALLLLSC
jgi:hypothetical protein